MVSKPFGTAPGIGAHLLYAPMPVKPDRDGRPRIFHAADFDRGAPVTLAMRSQFAQIASRLRPAYRARLAFAFAGTAPSQFFIVFLDGLPQYPVLNDCTAEAGCARQCPLYVHPVTRRAVPSTAPRCADRLPIWR